MQHSKSDLQLPSLQIYAWAELFTKSFLSF